MSHMPIILDKKILQEGLYSLLSAFSIPTLSEDKLRSLSTTLSNYIAKIVYHNKRRAKTPLDPTDLSFNILRTRNPAEVALDDSGNEIKGDKSWYFVVLSESVGGVAEDGNVQILVEGVLRKNKKDVLEGLVEMIERKLKVWENTAKEKERVLRMERASRMLTKEAVVGQGKEKEAVREEEEGNEMEEKVVI